jgi:hypothetical protein
MMADKPKTLSKSYNPYEVTKDKSGHKITLSIRVIPLHIPRTAA